MRQRNVCVLLTITEVMRRRRGECWRARLAPNGLGKRNAAKLNNAYRALPHYYLIRLRFGFSLVSASLSLRARSMEHNAFGRRANRDPHPSAERNLFRRRSSLRCATNVYYCVFMPFYCVFAFPSLLYPPLAAADT